MAVLWGGLFWARDFEIFPDIPDEASEASHVSSGVCIYGLQKTQLAHKAALQLAGCWLFKKGVEQRDGEVGVFNSSNVLTESFKEKVT